MDIQCEGCNSRFRIPDGKIPPGKTAGVNCPKCGHRIVVASGRQEAAGTSSPSAAPPSSEPEVEAVSPAPFAFDFLEEEGRTALLCEPDPGVRSRIEAILKPMEFQILAIEKPHEALRFLRTRPCDLVLVNEHFGAAAPNPVTLYLSRLSMATRREMFVVLLSAVYRTQDSMTAFAESVDLVLNLEQVGDLERHLRSGLAEQASFYEFLKDCMKEEGVL